jgi:hypothetical protein
MNSMWFGGAQTYGTAPDKSGDRFRRALTRNRGCHTDSEVRTTKIQAWGMRASVAIIS